MKWWTSSWSLTILIVWRNFGWAPSQVTSHYFWLMSNKTFICFRCLYRDSWNSIMAYWPWPQPSQPWPSGKRPSSTQTLPASPRLPPACRAGCRGCEQWGRGCLPDGQDHLWKNLQNRPWCGLCLRMVARQGRSVLVDVVKWWDIKSIQNLFKQKLFFFRASSARTGAAVLCGSERLGLLGLARRLRRPSHLQGTWF